MLGFNIWLPYKVHQWGTVPSFLASFGTGGLSKTDEFWNSSEGGGVAFFNPSFKQGFLSMKFKVKKSATWVSKNEGGECRLERIMLLLNSPPSTAASSGDCLQSACLPLLANEDQKWIKLAHWALRQFKMVSIFASIRFHTCFLKAVSCLDVEATRVCSCLLYFCCL